MMPDVPRPHAPHCIQKVQKNKHLFKRFQPISSSVNVALSGLLLGVYSLVCINVLSLLSGFYLPFFFFYLLSGKYTDCTIFIVQQQTACIIVACAPQVNSYDFIGGKTHRRFVIEQEYVPCCYTHSHFHRSNVAGQLVDRLVWLTVKL